MADKDFNFDDSYMNQPGLGTMDVYADIVYCIDLTSSMRPIIDKVKETAMTLHEELQRAMCDNYQRNIKQMRIKVIGFRDAYCDGPRAFEISKFFELPREVSEFKRFLDKLEAKGGGDIPENSLEAIALAFKSDWCKTIDPSVRKRHIVILFTDASAHDLEQAQNGTDEYYPKGMPSSYSELIDWWCGQGRLDSANAVNMDQVAKRFALFAPEDSRPWANIAEDIDACICRYIEAGNGGRDISTEKLLKLLGETMV